MLSPRNDIGFEAKNYGLGLGLGLVASGLGIGLGLVDAVASASTVWPRGLIVLYKNIALFRFSYLRAPLQLRE